MARYAKEVRVRFNGDPALCMKYLPEGRKVLGAKLDEMARFGLGLDVGKRQVINADGVAFRVLQAGSTPIVEIDVTKAVGAEPAAQETIDSFVVRPTAHGDFNAYGPDSYTLLRPEQSDGVRFVFDGDYAALFDEPGAWRAGLFYSLVFDEGVRHWGNLYWRSKKGKWSVSWHGHFTRYFGGDLSELYYWTQVYTKGQVLFDTTTAFVGTPAATAYPELVSQSINLRVLGACVSEQEDGDYLIVALGGRPNIGAIRRKEYVVAAKLRVADDVVLPDGVSLSNAAKFAFDADTVRVIDFIDWAAYEAVNPAVSAAPIAHGHPFVVNESGTEGRRVRVTDHLASPTNGYFVTEHIVRFADLEAVEAETVLYEHVIQEFPKTSTYEGYPNPYPGDHPYRADALYNGLFVVVRARSEASWTLDDPIIVAVDYKGDALEYAYTQDYRGYSFSSSTVHNVSVTVISEGSPTTSPEADFVTVSATASTESRTDMPLRTSFFERSHTTTIVSSATNNYSFTVEVLGTSPITRLVTNEVESETATSTSVIPRFEVIYMDLRYDLLVYSERTSQDALRNIAVVIHGTEVARTEVAGS